jgi:hypothetical protein
MAEKIWPACRFIKADDETFRREFARLPDRGPDNALIGELRGLPEPPTPGRLEA